MASANVYTLNRGYGQHVVWAGNKKLVRGFESLVGHLGGAVVVDISVSLQIAMHATF